MNTSGPLTTALGLTVLLGPALSFAGLGLSALLGRRPSERSTSRWIDVGTLAGLLGALGVGATMLARGTPHLTIELGQWVAVSDFHFAVKLLFDELSLAFVTLSLVLTYVVGKFARNYLHRDPGHHRFHLLYALFVLGMVTAALAGTIETLFTGWELVGLSSALLVAFFQERPAPVRNALRVWTVYRASDAALLLAAIALHHLHGAGDFDALLGPGPWPSGEAQMSPEQALGVGLLLLLAAAGKSALVPFSGWLPRAMEGPTPSSAVFYGALSVHLGAYLLLRVEPILELSWPLRVAVVLLGLVTALLAAVVGRAQTDVKSALAYASLTQVGLIVAEIGLGLTTLALVHMIGHACFRTLQFLRAPNLLQDYRALENDLGQRLPTGKASAPRGRRYRFAIERAYLDSFLDERVVGPFQKAFRWADAIERRWTDWLAGGPSRLSEGPSTNAPGQEGRPS